MIFLKFIHKKINRLLSSSKILKFFYFYHKLFNNSHSENLEFDFSNKKSRKQIIQEIIQKKNYKNYLEIGCFSNELFNYVECANKVGVDPVSGGTVRKSSDQFFRDNQDKFDCIFIDGLHEYDQVKKDIINSLNFLNKGGIILLHDCLPKNFYAQAIPRCQYNWNGDVWKAIVECRTNKDIDVYTCYADQGIGIILKEPNQNLLNYPKKNYKNLKFSEYYKDYKKLMNIIEYDDLLKII